MEKKPCLLLTIIVIIFGLNFTSAQTAKEILEKSVKAHGGLDKLTNWKNLKTTGEMVFDQSDAIKMRGALSRIFVKPDKARIDQDFTAFEPNNLFRTLIYNNDQSWSITNLIPNYSNMYKNTLKSTLDKADGIAYYFNKSISVNLKPESNIEGRPVYVLESIQVNDTSYLFIDKNTYLLVRDSLRNVSMVYIDFKNVNGVIIPEKFNQIVYSPQRVAVNKYKLDVIEFNTEIDPAIFEEEMTHKK
jgi:hypothetical protein